jgi:AcrR family transcriptional regulator
MPVTPTKSKKTAPPPKAYHHGDLPQALLSAAEAVLVRDGLRGLGLRSIAREAGVSHTAPKHHFGDITGLLSALAAVGYGRLREALLAGIAGCKDPRERGNAVGRAYVKFAAANPALFGLMFRNEIVDMQRSSLAESAWSAMSVMAAAIVPEGTAPRASSKVELAAQDTLRATASWAYIHGLATLLIDQRLRGLVAVTPAFKTPTDLVEAVLTGVRIRIDLPDAA